MSGSPGNLLEESAEDGVEAIGKGIVGEVPEGLFSEELFSEEFFSEDIPKENSVENTASRSLAGIAATEQPSASKSGDSTMTKMKDPPASSISGKDAMPTVCTEMTGTETEMGQTETGQPLSPAGATGRSLAASAARIPLARIARSFGQAAPHYDAHAELQRQVADVLMDMATLTVADATILDMGCGTGYCSGRLRSSYPQATLLALDLALPMLQSTAGRGLEQLSLLCADAEALPLREATMDLLVSSLTIQWCAHPARLFAELFRVVRSGGQVLLSTFGPATLQELRAAWQAVDTGVHVNGFAELPVLEQAAVNAGFRCAGTTELRQRYYPSLRAVARELKGIGAHNMNSGQMSGLTGRAAFAGAERAFSRKLVPGQGIPVSYEIYYLNLFKP